MPSAEEATIANATILGVSFKPLAKLVKAEESQWRASTASRRAATAGDSSQSPTRETRVEEISAAEAPDIASAPAPEIAARRSMQTQYVSTRETPRRSSFFFAYMGATERSGE